MSVERINVPKIVAKKAAGEKIVCLTAYDYPTAMLLDQSGVDIILVGDSLANTVLGYDNTLPVTFDEMLHHVRAVVRGSKRALVVGDMPFMSYQTSMEEGIRNAGIFIKEGCGAVKLECTPSTFPLVERLVEIGIPVMGHLGLTPQLVNVFGGYRVQAKTAHAAAKLIRDALTLQDLGVFSIVLELVPRQVARMVTERLAIPTIGIGAGADCDGQVLVLADMLGLFEYAPRHVKRYTNLREQIKKAVRQFTEDVTQGNFPTEEHSASISQDELLSLKEALEPRLAPKSK